MYTVSAAFTTALKSSHRIATKAEILDGGLVQATLKIIGGSVTVDRTAAIRRRCTVELTDPDGTLTPATASDLLAPFGNELKLYRGIALSTGDELVPQGVFGLSETEIVDTGDALTIRLEGYDRARKVQRARWTDAYAIASGTNYATAIKNLISNRVAGLTYNFMTTARTTPAVVFGTNTDNDPWRDAQGMARAIGAELYFDPDGVCVLRPEPDPATDPVTATYAEGSEATILNLARKLTTEKTYNGAIVTGEGTGVTTPVRAEVWDDNVGSPTYYLGDYGKVPYFLSSPLITTQAQADDAAAALLRSLLGGSEVIRFGAIVNPAHEASDVVKIIRARANVDAHYVLDSFGVPLSAAEPMTAITRERRAA